jgi:TolB-like protein
MFRLVDVQAYIVKVFRAGSTVPSVVVRLDSLSEKRERSLDAPDGGEEVALAQRPSIAVMPFTNVGGEKEQEYFADGITEDIITALGRFRWFFVIARNASFEIGHLS